MIIILRLAIIFCCFNTISIGQEITYDTLWQVSPKVYLHSSKDIKSTPKYSPALDSDAEFHYQKLLIKTKKTSNYCHAFYSDNIKDYTEDYQEKLKSGIPLEQADSFILWELSWYAGNFNRRLILDAWRSLGYSYENIVTFDKLQGKHHYIDYSLCLQYSEQIDRNKHWNIEKYDTVLVCHCKMERYLLVDSVIYKFSTSTLKRYRNRKKALRIAKRDFKKFVRCIWIKEEEE